MLFKLGPVGLRALILPELGGLSRNSSALTKCMNGRVLLASKMPELPANELITDLKLEPPDSIWAEWNRRRLIPWILRPL